MDKQKKERVLHSILFSKPDFDLLFVSKFLEKNYPEFLKIHNTKNFYRVRLTEPVKNMRYKTDLRYIGPFNNKKKIDFVYQII